MKMNKLIDLNLLRQFKTNLDRKITKLDEEQDRKVEAALEEVNGRVEDLSANLGTQCIFTLSGYTLTITSLEEHNT